MIYNNFSIILIKKLKLFPPKFETKLKSDFHMQSLIILNKFTSYYYLSYI